MYVTEALRAIASNTAVRGGHKMAKAYTEIITPQKVEPRTGEEVKAHMKSVLGRLAVNE